MQWSEALILGALQGVTEFLPISSSGHLVLGEELLGLNVETLKSFDVVLHLGTLLAILVYFWKDVQGMMVAFLKFISGKLGKDDPYGKLIIFIIIGTIPAVLLGYFGEEYLDATFRNVQSISILMIVVGCIFLLAEWVYKKIAARKSDVKSWWQSLIIGLAQAMALIPGVSRSGATITAAIFQGIERSSAARFSFLLGIPAMVGAGLLTGLKVYGGGGLGGENLGVLAVLIGFFSSLIFGLLSIWFLMKFLKKHGLAVFGVYRIVLGLVILIYFL